MKLRISKFRKFLNFIGDYTAVKVGGKWGIMTINGQWLVEPTYKDIQFIVPTGEAVMIFR